MGLVSMNLIEQYLYAENREQRAAIMGSIQHRLKYVGEQQNLDLLKEYQLDNVPESFIDSLDEEQMILMTKIAVTINYTLRKYLGVWLKWTKHPKLKLKDPIYDRGFNELEIFHCPQEMLEYNYFCDGSSLEVI